MFSKVLLASDHRGVELKKRLMEHLGSSFLFSGINSFLDLGPFDALEKVDYPVFSKILCHSIETSDTCGILICGSGIGMSISANRFSWIRASLCFNEESALSARTHNNANVLVLSSDHIGKSESIRILDVFIKTPFERGRHEDRIAML